MRNFYALIMAGGSGTRLWPLSRQHSPKQALRLVGNRTMFQQAADRLETLLPMERVLVVTARNYVDTLAAQVRAIPRENFIVESTARGTAGAIGLAAIHLSQRDPEAVMAVLTADHYIQAVDRFQQALLAAYQLASQDHIVTLGIQPAFPATGYGYIRRSQWLGQVDGFGVYDVDTFVEKPDATLAAEFLASGLYSWNSGMFIWKVSRVLAEFARQMPAFYAQLQAVAVALNRPDYDRVLEEIWPNVRNETIDYGIMEKAQDVIVIPVDIGWTDVGDWGAVYNLTHHTPGGSVVIGADHDQLGTDTCLIRCDKKLIAAVGLKDTIIINTEDAILICARDRAQDVKLIVERLQAAGETEYL
jgi:mannose-1-phosphate guanylyltransferase